MTILTELEVNVADAWLKSGAIRVESFGTENTYYLNEFNHSFYCKNYPSFHTDLAGIHHAE